MLTEEQAGKIKEQIMQQIDSWHASKEQKEQAKEQIKNMPVKELEDFLIKNKLIKTGKEQKGITQSKHKREEECPFCLILQGKIPAYKIDENKASMAVLEINPLSLGHTIIIPKTHIPAEKLPTQAFSLAKKISRKLKSKLKSKEASIQTANAFGHGIINLIPIYDEKLERKKASETELKQLQEKLTAKKRKLIKIKEKSEKLEKAPKRFP